MRYLALIRAASRELLGGRLAAAERMINEAFGLGMATGQPEASDVWGTQTLHLRHQQGRLNELAGALESVDIDRPHPMPRPAVAWGFALLGRIDEARSTFHSALDHLDDYPEDEFTLPVLGYLAEAAALLRDRDAASELLSRLEPFPTQHGNVGVVVMPVTHYFIGLLAATIGAYGQAVTSLQNAANCHRRVSAPFFVACSQSALANLE